MIPVPENVLLGKLRISLPLAISHSLTVLSQLPEAKALPSPLMATEVTKEEWPSKLRTSLPLAIGGY